MLCFRDIPSMVQGNVGFNIVNAMLSERVINTFNKDSHRTASKANEYMYELAFICKRIEDTRSAASNEHFTPQFMKTF